MKQPGKISLRQLWFGFAERILPTKERKPAAAPPIKAAPVRAPEAAPAPAPALQPPTNLIGRDLKLEKQCRDWLAELGLHEGSMKVQVIWNAKLRSTAGYAKWPQWQVELNPRLVEFEGQVDRTLRHELAHLIAYARASRRRIEPHGPEWQKACADLGIPDETARHTLPLPRSTQARQHIYVCPACGFQVERVKKFRRHTACLHCCKKHAGGRFDARFQFVLQK